MIKVNHLGEDYSTIEINGFEFEASLGLGQALLNETKIEKKVMHSLETLVDYTLENEQKHYEENGKESGHIYEEAVRVQKWMADRKQS